MKREQERVGMDQDPTQKPSPKGKVIKLEKEKNLFKSMETFLK